MFTTANDYLGKYVDYKFRRKGKEEDLLADEASFARRLPLETESKIRIEQERPRTTYVQLPDGSVVPYEGKFSRTPSIKPEKKSRKIITSIQADQLRNAGVDVNDLEYVIHDAPSTAGKSAEKEDIAKYSIDEISRILPLNEKSSGGFFGGLKQKAMSAANIESETFRNTADVVNSARSLVARVLKSTFGGQLSDSEREYLNSVYGAMPNYSVAERRIALTNVKRMLEKSNSQGSIALPKTNNSSQENGVKETDLQVGKDFGGGKIKSVRWK